MELKLLERIFGVIDSTRLQVNKDWVHSSLSCLAASRTRIARENLWGDWVHLTPSQKILSALLLELIGCLYTQIARENIWGDWGHLNPSLYDKILMKMLNNSWFSTLNLILGTRSMLALITTYISIIKPNNKNKNEIKRDLRRKKGDH